MQLPTPKVSEVFGNTDDATEVSIKMNAFTFEALSGDKLYKNLKRAIVREVACNCYDAHVMAGTQDKPFDIHLPTELSPFLSFRDYGIGLDDNGVRKVFLTYFDSTKRDDNTVIGAWGLGSKSPLGYTDNFTIVAFKDGVCRTYCVFKKPESGIPAVTKLAESTTDEPNGLHIQIPVTNINDFGAFKREAMDVLRWFPVKPNINIEHEFVKREYILRDIVEGVHYYKGNSHYDGLKAIQGMIEYPISLPDKDKIAEDLRGLLNYKLEMHFGIGELQFSMSREELSYSEHTLRSIEKKLRQIKNALVPKLELELAQCVTEWEKAIKLNSYAYDSGNILREATQDAIAAGKSPVHTRLKQGKFGVEDGITDDAIAGVHLALQHIDNNHHRRNSNRTVAIKFAHKRSFANSKQGWNIEASDKTLFVLDDVNKRTTERIRLHIEKCNKVENGIRFKSLVVFGSPEKGKQLSNNALDSIKAFVKLLGHPNVVKVSDMPMPEKTTRATITKGDLLIPSSTTRSGYSWQTCHSTVPATAMKYYVELKGSEIVTPMFAELSTTEFAQMVSTMRQRSLIAGDAMVAGVRKNMLDAITTDKTWMPLQTYMEKMAKKITEKRCINALCKAEVDKVFKDHKQILNAMGADAKVIADILNSDTTLILDGKNVVVDPPVVKLLQNVKLVKQLDNEVKIVSNTEDEIGKKFPMLWMIKDRMYHGGWGEAMQDVLSYINMVQTSTK